MRPTRRSLLLLGLWAGLALGAPFALALLWLWAVFCAGLMAALALDAFGCWRSFGLKCERDVQASLPLDRWSPVELRLRSTAGTPLQVQIHDHHPTSMESRHLPRSLEVPAEGYVDVSYALRPLQRGDHAFDRAEVLVDSQWGLFVRRLRIGECETVRVYPDFGAVMKYALLATDNRLSQMGIRKRRRRGQGLEFHQLREYRQGDSLRQIDWKTTARLSRVISREYQDERDQQIVFLLDCGRRMHTQDGALSHFDHSLNAMLLLANVALRQGDSVGLLTFGGERRWLPPRKGLSHLNQLLHSVYDLETTTRPPDYLEAVKQTMAQIDKRSLVILVSNLRDEDGDELSLALRSLRKRHLVLVASLREKILGETLAGQVHSFDDALRVAATHRYLASRRDAHARLAREWTLWLDTEPQELPIRLVNRYLDIKASGQL